MGIPGTVVWGGKLIGVYIEGIEMPKKGCIKMLVLLCDGKVIETTPGCQPQPEAQNYKAVHVPEHGRLIDQDAILREVIRGDYPNQWIDKNELLRLFRNAPAIIEAEEGE